MARKGTMYDKVIESSYLQETMTLKIYEPEIIDPLYETNVCIMQDGNDYYQLGRVATISDRLHDSGDIVNTVFVGIHYIDRFDRLKKYHPNGEQYEQYQQFLTKEVVPLIERMLPLNPLGTVWAMMGDSLAGTLALLTTLSYPDLFQKAILQSPLVDDVVLEKAQQCEKGHTFEIYHSIGLNESSVKTTAEESVDFVTPNKQLHEILQANVPNYHYKEIESGNHTWKYWQEELPDILALMFG